MSQKDQVSFLLVSRPQAGFSLVELMSVIAILGVLTAAALAQFSRYKARALQTEAKLLLANSYTGLKSHKAEFGYFTACLKQVGAFPVDHMIGVHGGWYAYGFTSLSAIAAICGEEGTDSCSGHGDVQANTTCQIRDTLALPLKNSGISLTDVVFDLTAFTVVSSSSYILEASGHINENVLVFDRWRLDEGKHLLWVQSGI